jgi:ribosomal protein S18 acetylase RimI-like enzyme
VLERAAGLSQEALDAIAELERRVIAADGGRLKLEWGTLRRRSGEQVEDLLWWEQERLVGFLGLYGSGAQIELAGMVAPEARRRGIATALLDAAASLCRARGQRAPLLIVPSTSNAGKSLALRRGGRIHHSEHALVLAHPPTSRPRNPAVSVRTAHAADIPLILRLLEAGFGEPAPKLRGELDASHERTLIVECRGSPVGTLRLTRDGEHAGIYGFATDPSWQGRGIGRDALSRACDQLCADGARLIGLEVEVENDQALALYRPVGFQPLATEDYFAIPLD